MELGLLTGPEIDVMWPSYVAEPPRPKLKTETDRAEWTTLKYISACSAVLIKSDRKL